MKLDKTEKVLLERKEEEKDSYKIQRDIGNILRAFGIKREATQITLDGGKRGRAYTIEMESLARLWADAQEEIARLRRRHERTSKSKQIQHLQRCVEASKQDRFSEGETLHQEETFAFEIPPNVLGGVSEGCTVSLTSAQYREVMGEKDEATRAFVAWMYA